MFTDREIFVLRALSFGLTVDMVCDMQNWNSDEIGKIMNNTRTKLRAKTDTQAVAHAIRRGVIN